MYKSPATRETCTFKKTQTQYIYDKKVTILSTLLFLVLLVSSVSYFNRAPERLIPDNVDVLSPVNGTVIHIEDTEQSEIDFYKKDVLQSLAIAGMTPPFQFVVVEMDPSNIHVQRAPITGVITHQEYTPGKHANALWSKDVEKLANINEKVLTVFTNDRTQVGVIQVAGAMARRIKNNKSLTDEVSQGEMYGRITLGSQVVIVLPKESYALNIENGQTVTDGETPIATFR